VFGVCGAEPLPAGSGQENHQGIVPAKGILILFCHAEVHQKHLGETENQNQNIIGINIKFIENDNS